MDYRPYPIIAGPTASGKTGLAVALAHRLGAEVVNADSMQVYADVCIGTARPSAEEQQGIPHHLMGFLPLGEKYSVARYVGDAGRVFEDIYARGGLPLMCGGTGLYIQSFMENIQFFPQPSDPAVRERLMRQAEERGGAALRARLEGIDPTAAARLHDNDIHRIVRALEIYETTGQTITEQERLSRAVPSPYTACLFVLQFRDREALYRRIEQRVDAMLGAGLVDEARRVLQTEPGATVLQAIGYKELIPYLEGRCSLDEAATLLKTETRRYAKRQLSWFRRMPQGRPVYADDYPDPAALCDAVERQYTDFCKERG